MSVYERNIYFHILSKNQMNPISMLQTADTFLLRQIVVYIFCSLKVRDGYLNSTFNTQTLFGILPPYLEMGKGMG